MRMVVSLQAKPDTSACLGKSVPGVQLCATPKVRRKSHQPFAFISRCSATAHCALLFARKGTLTVQALLRLLGVVALTDPGYWYVLTPLSEVLQSLGWAFNGTRRALRLPPRSEPACSCLIAQHSFEITDSRSSFERLLRVFPGTWLLEAQVGRTCPREPGCAVACGHWERGCIRRLRGRPALRLCRGQTGLRALSTFPASDLNTRAL